jgi:aryl-alcohol dehydrogenase-like predicted oxidoreductase
LEHALQRGVIRFDTADICGAGANEEFLSPFVKANREQLALATKFGSIRKADDPHYPASAATRPTSARQRRPACGGWTST